MSELMCQFAFYPFTGIARLPIASENWRFFNLLPPLLPPFTRLLPLHMAQHGGSLAIGRQNKTPLKGGEESKLVLLAWLVCPILREAYTEVAPSWVTIEFFLFYFDVEGLLYAVRQCWLLSN